MQVEAYVISPRIMNKAVSVPGSIVVIAAIAGGSLLGILGALGAIPVAASIIIIVKEVLLPRQEKL
jgi:predicted PurR-regulated permease PerM